ncbi:MAG: nicotinamide mononucleotide transporter [Lachnospiraceae bacterium]|nr:nicotinamide mononucleotide transporter [Lachnospiraceae bacterium]
MFNLDMKRSFKTLKWYEWIMAVVMIAIAAKAMITAFVHPSAGGNPPWLTVINFVSAVCGVVCIFFCAKANIGNYIFGIVNTVVYAIYLLYWKIYGTFALEVFYYLPTNIIGWYLWSKRRDVDDSNITLSKKLTPVQNILTAVFVASTTVVYHGILAAIGGTVAWLDAATVAIGLVATFLQMKRYREQYVWWLVTDVVAVVMYIAHFDAVYLTKKTIYLIMAVIGLINWIKLNRKNVANV